ncbi:MAG: EH signature domain-containing protein [Chlorobiaceae bacterium]
MFELQVALDGLKGLSRLLENSVRQQVHKVDENYFPKITRIIAQLESNMLVAVAPKSLRPKYRQLWLAYCEGNISEIDKTAIKWLCWESDIVHNQRFAEYLFRNVAVARARVIKGLVWTLHQNWVQKLPKIEITEYTAKQLNIYSGADRVLVKWQTDIITIIGESGPANFAKKNLLKENKSPKDASKEWALYEFSEYMYSVVAYAIDACVEDVVSSSDVIDYLFDTLLTWPGWERDRSILDIAVKKLVLHPDVNQFSKQLQHAILNHQLLGDPRLPANRNKWVGVEKNAIQQFIIWLSKEDIYFFFDYVLKGQDPHGRRDFWLNYVHKLIGCRSLLSDSVASQLHGNKNIKFGRLSNTQNRAAFILDFGRMVAVEFSNAGGGCVYLFQRDEFDDSTPDMWSNQYIPEFRLKNQDLSPECRVRHTGFWQSRVANVLAINGVRP